MFKRTLISVSAAAAAAALMIGAHPAAAQYGPGPGGGPGGGPGIFRPGPMAPPTADGILAAWNQTLAFTTDEQGKIRPILQKMLQDIGAAIQDPALPANERRQQIDGIRTAAYAQVNELLDPAQQQKFKAIEAQPGFGMGRPGGPPGGPPTADQLTQMLTMRLNLTPDQQTTIKPIVDKMLKDIEAIRKAASTQIRGQLTAAQQQTFDTSPWLLTGPPGGPPPFGFGRGGRGGFGPGGPGGFGPGGPGGFGPGGPGGFGPGEPGGFGPGGPDRGPGGFGPPPGQGGPPPTDVPPPPPADGSGQ